MRRFSGLAWLLKVQTSVLIDSIVRQTTVLIAQLSTASGLRAPLAHVANQVFLHLVTELEAQGVGRKVIADMFGLALRSYQQKVQRLQESASERDTTLWEAVLGFIQEHKTASRAQVLSRFSDDDSATVRGVLNDLVGSALVYRTSSGDATVYRATRAEDTANALSATEQTAVLEHFQAMVGAIRERLALVSGPHENSPHVGSSTFGFEVWPGHPHYEQVQSLLAKTRGELTALSRAVQGHNAEHESPSARQHVTFYFGQSVRAEESPSEPLSRDTNRPVASSDKP